MHGLTILFAVSSLTLGTTPESGRADAAWWQWRGPKASGVAPEATPPTEWSESKNIRWKVEVPGQGLSTPIVWGDLVFVQTAIPANSNTKEDAAESSGAGKNGDDPGRAGRGPRGGRGGPRGMRPEVPTEPYRFTVVALDRRSGKTVWERCVREQVPHEGSHTDGSLASASPVTDGEHLYAYFGSRGLYCLTMGGKVVWETDLGDMKTRKGFGEGSSPAIHGDTIVVNWDHEGDSFIVALDKATGKETWRRERDEVTSWSTPLFVEDGGKALVVVSATNRVRAYDLALGDVVWECSGLGLNCAPTPVAGDGLVFAMSGYRDPALLAIRYGGAKGDLTGTPAVVWSTTEGTSYIPSPLLYDDTLYFLQKNTGILTCVDPKTGKPYYDKQRLEGIGGIYASPVGAADHVYIAGRDGKTVVLKRGHSFEVAAINELDESFTASPAIAGNELYLRGLKHLYCIARE